MTSQDVFSERRLIFPEHLDRFGEEYYRNNLALPAEADQQSVQ
jgi:hypothetical protein